MTFFELVKQVNLDPQDIGKCQMFYQEGYLQGIRGKNPNYEYSINYQKTVNRLLKLFEYTGNPVELEKLNLCLDNLDKFKKENNIL